MEAVCLCVVSEERKVISVLESLLIVKSRTRPVAAVFVWGGGAPARKCMEARDWSRTICVIVGR